LARIKVGLDSCLYLGNLDAKRDWGHARDYVYMQWLMLQQERPEDYVIATGQQRSVREFIELSAAHAGLNLRWEGTGVSSKAIDLDSGRTVVAVDPTYFRPTEVESLLGDPTKAQQKLGWRPTTTLEDLVKEMVASDLEDARKEVLNRAHGFTVHAHHE
jgi:GDPmannose 4,6-dehydratase